MSVALKIAPLPRAVSRMAAKTPVKSALSSAEWARMPLALRERAQFSSRVEKVRVMAAIQDKLLKHAAMLREARTGLPPGTPGAKGGGEAFVHEGSFIADLKKTIREEGIGIGGGGLTDISSAKRLKLIYDFQNQSASAFARWQMGQDPDALDNFPAQEFLRVEDRENPRNWAPRWDAAFAPFKGATQASSGRMVALMNHPGWSKLSAFGTPWPPFDFGSGMGVESVDREDAVALGVIAADQRIESAEIGFNDQLEASMAGLGDTGFETLRDYFGDQIQQRGDKIAWQGNLIGDLVDDVVDYGIDRPFDSKAFAGRKIDVGAATTRATEMAAPYLDISGMRMQIAPDNVYHIFNEHGQGVEKRGDQRPVSKLDIEVLPHVWREPDKIEPGKIPRSLVFWKTILGKTRLVEWNQHPKSKVMFPTSMLIKK